MQQAGGAYIPLKLDLTQFNRSTATAMAGLKKIGLAAGAIYALQKAFKASTDAAIEFNRQIHNIWTLTDETRGQMKKLGNQIRALSRQYNTASAESARALYQIYSATFYGASGMKILEESTKGAAAGLSNVFSVADMLTTVLNAYRMSAEQTSHVNDLLFTTIKYGKTTMSELADQFGRLAGVAAPAGASIEEMTAAIATLTRQGIATDWAVTSLRQTIMQLLRPGKELEAVINDLGYASGRALIEHEGFAQAIKLVGDYAEQNGIRMEQLFSNVRAVTAVLPLATTAAGEYVKDLERMTNSAGAAEAAFRKQASSWQYQLAKMSTAVQDMAISLGQFFVPGLVAGAKAVEFFASGLRLLFDILTKVRDVIGDVVDKISGGIVAGGSWVIDFFAGLIGGAQESDNALSNMSDTALDLAASLKSAVDALKDFNEGSSRPKFGGVPEGLSNLSIGGASTGGGLSLIPNGGINYLRILTPQLVADWQAAQRAWARLTATLSDNTQTAEEIAKAYQDMSSMADMWETVATAIVKDMPALSAEMLAQVEEWRKALGDTAATNVVIQSAKDFRDTLSDLVSAFTESKTGSLEQAIALQGLQEALAQAKAYVATLDEEQIAANADLLGLIDSIEALGITADDSADAVATFNTALANVSSTLGSVAAQIGATFAQLEQEAMKATQLGEVANIVQGLIGGAANIKSTMEGLERIITGAFPAKLKQWAQQWHDALQGSYPEPGKTYEEIQREQEQAAKKAAAAAKKAAREAAQAAKEAAQAAQDAFKEMFNIPALAGIQKGSWEEAAKVIIGFAQNRNKLYDMAKALEAVNGKKLDEADVIDLIISAQRQLLSSLDNQIKILQFAGEDATALEEMKTRIEELFDPLGALKKKIREILGLSTTSPAIGGAQLRSLLLAIASGGKIPKLATGGEVLTAGVAYLHPGETVTPATVNPLSGGGFDTSQLLSSLKDAAKTVATGFSACAGGMCAVTQEAQQTLDTAQSDMKKAYETATVAVKRNAQAVQLSSKGLEDLQEMFKATVGGDAEALNKLLKAAKPGEEAWKLLMQAYKDHVAETESLIEDYKLLGLSTEELEKGLNQFRAAVQGTTPLLLSLREVLSSIKDAFADFARSGIYEILKYLLGPLFGTLKKGTESLGSSLNVPTGYKVARAAWKAAKPGEPGVLKGGGEEESLIDKLLALFSTFLDKVLQIISNELGDWIVKALGKIDWAAIGGGIVAGFTALWNQIYQILEPVLGPVLALLGASLEAVVTAFMAAGIAIGLFEGVIAIAYGAIQGLAEDLQAFFEPVLDAIGKAWERLQPVIEATKNLFAVFAPVFKAFGEIVAKGIEYMTDLFVALAPVIQVLADIANAIMPALVAAINVAAKALDFVLTPVVNIVVSALNVLASVLKVVGNAFIALYNYVLRPIINFGITVINALADLYNGISGLVKAVTFGLVDLGRIEHVGYMPELPYLQLGGEILKEGLAYLHPNEFVIPAAQVEPLPTGVGSGGTIAIKNYLIVDGRVLAESTNRVSRQNDKLMTGSTIGGRAWRVA